MKLYNHTQEFWNGEAKRFGLMPGAGPTVRVLEGNVWSIPGGGAYGGSTAAFETSEEAEKVLLEAGFKFVAIEKGFRVSART